MKIKNIFYILLCMGIFTIYGCNNANNENKSLVMATNAQFPPFEYREGNDFKGIDIDLAQEITKRLNKKLEITDMEFDSVILSVSSQKSDFALSGLTINENRAKVVDFSIPYYSAAQMILVKEENNIFSDLTTPEEAINKINELGKIRIGVALGTTGSFFVQGDQDWGFEGFKQADIKSFDSGALAVAALVNDQLDLVIFDEMPARILAKVHSGAKVLPFKLTDEQYAVGVQKNNKELLNAINKVLEEIKKDGTLDKIIQQHLLDLKE